MVEETLWSKELGEVIARTLLEAKPFFEGQALAILAVDCHPWHGHLERVDGSRVITRAVRSP